MRVPCFDETVDNADTPRKRLLSNHFQIFLKKRERLDAERNLMLATIASLVSALEACVMPIRADILTNMAIVMGLGYQQAANRLREEYAKITERGLGHLQRFDPDHGHSFRTRFASFSGRHALSLATDASPPMVNAMRLGESEHSPGVLARKISRHRMGVTKCSNTAILVWWNETINGRNVTKSKAWKTRLALGPGQHTKRSYVTGLYRAASGFLRGGSPCQNDVSVCRESAG